MIIKNRLSLFSKRIIFVLLFLVFAVSPKFAQPNISFSHLSIKDGLSQNTVFCIDEDNYGFMWFGTEDGLNRYDGYEFKTFKHNSADSNSIQDDFITFIDTDEDGQLWLGHLNGVSKYNPNTQKFYRYDKIEDLNGKYVNYLLIDEKSERVWVSTSEAGFGFIDKKTDQYYSFKKSEEDSSGLISNFVYQTFKDSSGNLWLGTNKGFQQFDPNNRKFSKPFYTNASVRDFAEDEDGIIWIATYGKGILRFDPKSNDIEVFRSSKKNDYSLSSDRCLEIHYIDKNNIWIGTIDGGLNIFDTETKRFYQFQNDPKNPNSISGNFIEYIFEDTKGIIWLGNNADGINIFNPKREKFKRYSSQPGNPTGLSDDMIYSIFEDPDEMGEMVWIGTDKGGLNHFNRESGQSKVYKHEPQNSFSLIHNSVRAIYKDYYGILWIGTTNGLVTFDERDEKFEFYRGLKDLFSGLNIRTIFDDKINPSRYLWISATGVGMLKFDRETNTIETFDTDPNKKQTLSNRLIRATFADSSGMVWVGTLGGGLNRIDSKTGEIKYYRHSNEDQNSIGDNLILSITEDSNDSTQILWIGTAGGFDKFHVETETFERFSEIDGLPNNVVYGILQDDDGFLWISTNLGISKFDPNTKKFRNYDIYDGLQNNEFNAGAYFKSRSGELFFGGITGFNIFHPDSIKDNEYAPPVFITSFKKFEKEAVTDKSVYLLNQFDLNYDEDFFSFEFAALNFTSPEKNQYAYKMEGFDRNWIYCGTRRYVSYTNLDPGKYTFRVKASNNDGVWNEEGNSVRISISPPFWRTWWAYSFYLIAFGFFAAGSNWVVKNRRSIMALRKRKISHYRLLELIGKGGVGEVFKALDLNSKKIVALKLLSNELLENKENRDRFVREGQVMKSFSHPNIVKTFQFGESEHQGYIAMEYLTGGTLKEFIQKRYPLKRTDIKKIIEQTCFGLQQIHLQGIIHRDIKSANIMLDEEQNVRIMDFGLSRSPLAQTMTTLGTAMGTLGYVAPEQITNFNVDHRVDIFSLGVVFYEMLTNELPFAGENEMALIHSIFNNNPKPPSELINSANKKLDHLILSCLAKQPEERYSSVSDFLEDFERNF